MKRFLFLMIAVMALSACTKEEATQPYNPTTPTTPEDPGGSGNDDDKGGSQDSTSSYPKPVVNDTVKVVSQSFNVNHNSIGKGSFIVKFNNPVRVNSMKMEQFLLSYTMTDNDSTVVIDAPIAYGNTYKLQLDVYGKTSSRKWSFGLAFDTFRDRWEYDGMVRATEYDYETGTLWMATEQPYRIYRIPMDNPANATYKEFKQCMNTLALNPYNHKLYAGTKVSNYREASIYDFKIHVLDPKTLNEESSFVISEKTKQSKDDNGKEYWFPDATPQSMAFTEDGFGIALLKHYGSDGTDLCVIDSKNGNKLSYDRECWTNRYTEVTRHYDKNSLVIILAKGMGEDFYTVSRSKPKPVIYKVHPKFHSDEYYAGGNRVTQEFHHSKPWYYAQSVYSMCRIDYTTDIYSPVVMDDVRGTYAMAVDYLHDDYVVSANTYDQSFKYKDTSTGQITNVVNWAGSPGSNPVTMFYVQPSDLLLTVYAGWGTNTILTSYDMKWLRETPSACSVPR